MRSVNISNFDFGSIKDRSTLIDDDDVAIAHFNVGNGHATVVGGVVDHKLYYAVSLCSPIDNFNKFHGRRLAYLHLRGTVEGSANKRGVIGGNFQDVSPPEALTQALERYLSGKRHLPKWAKCAEISLRGKYRGSSVCGNSSCCGNCK